MKVSVWKMRRLVVAVAAVLCWLGDVGSSARGQEPEKVQSEGIDSNDVFYKHIHLSRFVVSTQSNNPELKEVPVPISTMSGKELRQTTATNVVDAIATQPGVSQITTGGGIAKPVIRGLGYNRIVTVVDGVRQEGQQWGDEHGIEVDGAAVNAVEIIKGPASLLYGSDAMAGVLILKSAGIAPTGEVRGNVSTEYQSNNGLWGYSAFVEGNQHGLVWNARWSQKGAHEYQNRYDGYVPGSQFNERAAAALLGLNRDKGFSHLRLSWYNTQLGIIEGERDTTTGALLGDDEAPMYAANLPFQRVTHYKAVWDNAYYLPAGKVSATVAYQQNQRQEYEESADDYELYFQLHTLTYNATFAHTWKSGLKLTTGIGGMGQQSRNLGEEYLIPAYGLFDAGLFAMASQGFKRWTFSGGVRGDLRTLHSKELMDDGVLRFSDFRRDYEALTGRLGAVWNIRDGVALRANVSRGFRAPNLSELAANGVHEGTNRYEVGNADLKAEYSWQADLGADYSTQHLTAQIALFANHIDNYIFAHRTNEVLQAGTDTYRYTQGDARLMGLEVGIDAHPIHSLHIGTNFAYVDAQQLHQPASSRYLPLTPPANWKTDVKWEITHSGKHLNHMFVAAEADHYFAQNHYYEAYGTETRTPHYTLVNVSAGCDILVKGHKRAELYLTVQNLLDAAYQSHLSRLKQTDINVVTGRQGVYNMGRNIGVKVVVPLSFKSYTP